MKNNVILFCLMLGCFSIHSQSTYKRNFNSMGCNFDITITANSQKEANTKIDLAIEEIERIEHLISSWKPTSQTSKINRNAGIKPVVVDHELFQLIKRSIALSEITDGAFDISFAATNKIWKFNGKEMEMPSKVEIAEFIKAIGYKDIILNNEESSVFLSKKGMKIGFGAIGKGYAADKAKHLLQQHGVLAGIINASGDMNSWGLQPSSIPWKVAIVNPLDVSKNFGLFELKNSAVVTSGNYEKYLTIEGKRYAHIIDPRTGMPTKGILSVTVFAPKAEMADALATAVFVLGDELGISLINQLPKVEAIIVKDDGNLKTSNNINVSTK